MQDGGAAEDFAPIASQMDTVLSLDRAENADLRTDFDFKIQLFSNLSSQGLLR